MNFLTTKEVAERLAVDPGEVRDWIRRGELAAIDVSSQRKKQARYRISEEELERFQRMRQVSVAPVVRRRRSKFKRVYT